MHTQSNPTRSIPKTSRALPIALLRARETVMAPIRDMLQEAGISEQKWRVLRTLEECGQIEQSAVSRETCVSMPSLTRILRAMENAGHIARKIDTQDKRRSLIRITAKGRAILSANAARANEIYDDLEARLGSDKINTLLDLLEELQRH